MVMDFMNLLNFFQEFSGASSLSGSTNVTPGFGAVSSRKDLPQIRTPINPNQEVPETQAMKT